MILNCMTRRPGCHIYIFFYSRLREHVEDPDKLPILIFPEGTCINNTSVMQFKKGSFEVKSFLSYKHYSYNHIYKCQMIHKMY